MISHTLNYRDKQHNIRYYVPYNITYIGSNDDCKSFNDVKKNLILSLLLTTRKKLQTVDYFKITATSMVLNNTAATRISERLYPMLYIMTHSGWRGKASRFCKNTQAKLS